MPKPLIKIKDVKVIYNLGKSNEFYALNGINAVIYPEEYIVFFGPSGCGKSTVLYTILGILPPTSGKITIKGKNTYSFATKELVEFQQKTIGIVYQAFYLIPSLSVLDNVVLPQIFMGVPPSQRKKRGLELLERFGIKEQAKKLPSALSGGQMQRVAISRSLVNNPEILLADEPTGNLDETAARKVMQTFKEINEEDKKTIILVSHDPRCLSYAHRVYFLKDGMVEREFINPEKVQIKPAGKESSLASEVEKLAKIYPYATPEELKVKSVVNYLTQELNFDQIEKLEEFTKLTIEGKIDKNTFFILLRKPFSQGGVGVNEAKAREMADKLEEILKESLDIRRYRRKLKEGEKFSERKKYIRKLRRSLLDQYEGEITPLQLKRLEEAIEDRVSGYLRKKEFQKRLDLSLDKNGVGLNRRTAESFTRYLEKLIAQGV